MKVIINLPNEGASYWGKNMYNRRGVFWPVAAILVGSVILLVKLQVLPVGILSYWPVLLIVFGLIGLSNIDGGGGVRSRSRVGSRGKKRVRK